MWLTWRGWLRLVEVFSVLMAVLTGYALLGPPTEKGGPDPQKNATGVTESAKK